MMSTCSCHSAICHLQLQWQLQFDAFSLDLADFNVPAEVCSEEAEIAEVGTDCCSLAVID